MATTGTDFLNEISSMKTAPEWSAAALRHLLNGESPSWIDSKHWLPVTAQIDDGKGTVHRLTYYVSPDYISVGTDQDFALAVLTPMDAQKLADSIGAILPTRRMALAIYNAASQKIPLSDVKNPPSGSGIAPLAVSQIDTPGAISNARAIDRLRYTVPPQNGIIDGHRKNVVIGPNLDGSKVAIYGGAGGSVDGVFWQPYSTIHDSTYADYSHGTRLIFDSLRSLIRPAEASLPLTCRPSFPIRSSRSWSRTKGDFHRRFPMRSRWPRSGWATNPTRLRKVRSRTTRRSQVMPAARRSPIHSLAHRPTRCFWPPPLLVSASSATVF